MVDRKKDHSEELTDEKLRKLLGEESYALYKDWIRQMEELATTDSALDLDEEKKVIH